MSYSLWTTQIILEVFFSVFTHLMTTSFTSLSYIREILKLHSLGSIPSCSVEEMFLCRLLQKDSIEANGNDGIIKYVEEALSLRHASTRLLFNFLEDCGNAQRAQTESIARALTGNLSSEGQKKS